MRKNTAGQCIKFLLLDVAGLPVTTGVPVVYIAIDDGAQSTGTGVSVHLGNGQWRYPPSQAETNGDCIGYLATNVGAVSVHQLVYTDAHFDPAADAVDLNADQSGVTVGTVNAMAGTIGTLDALDTAQDLLHAATQALADAILLDTGTDGVALSAALITQIADEILIRDWTAAPTPADRSVMNALRPSRNNWGFPGGVYTVYEEDDVTVAWTGVVTSSATAEPITGIDPV